jgi:hypothetical protein
MPRKRDLGLLLVALALGAATGWADSRPGWEDTGVTDRANPRFSEWLGLAWPSAAWLWALAVGGWVPLLELPRDGNPAALMALVIAFMGALAGALLRRVLNTLSPAGGQPPTEHAHGTQPANLKVFCSSLALLLSRTISCHTDPMHTLADQPSHASLPTPVVAPAPGPAGYAHMRHSASPPAEGAMTTMTAMTANRYAGDNDDNEPLCR